MHCESEVILEGRQVCTRLAEPAITTRVKRNDPFADQISMDPKDIEEKHRISMLVAFHDADVDRMDSKPDATPLRTVFKDERSCVRTKLRSSTGSYLIDYSAETGLLCPCPEI